MTEQTIIKIEAIIEYIETHLNEKLSLDTVATAVHYSKYHLSRLFFDTVGLHLNDYVKRRQLTEAAKLLIFSKKPIIDIALLCGYQSQQSFTAAFKSMYKAPPAEYRANRNFYPLQLRFTLEKNPPKEPLTHADICLATESDIVDWMTLMHLTIDGYPEMNEDDYLFHLRTGILENRALILRHKDLLIGAMLFSRTTGSIDYLGVHPQYRNKGIHKLFIDALLHTYLPNQDLCMTTYRVGDKADTGHRALLYTLGFAERELLVEYGYPTQKFVLSVEQGDKAHD